MASLSPYKNLKKTTFLCLSLLFSIQCIWAQPAGSSWRDHLSYQDASLVCMSGSNVMIASPAGIAEYNKASGTFQKTSKVNGLTDAGISALAFSAETSATVIGYSDGNIDILTGGKTYNINDLQKNSTYTSKRINHILCYQSAAYLSSNFGILKIDLRRKVITESYLIGEGGSPLPVHGLSIWNGMFYAATTQGIRRAPLTGVPLTDYSHWTLVTDIPNSQGSFSQIASTEQRLLVCFNDQYLYEFDGDQWTPYSLPDESATHIVRLSATKQQLIVVRTLDIFGDNAALTTPQQMINQSAQNLQVRDIVPDTEGTLWMADLQRGLVEYPTSGLLSNHTPLGPAAPLKGTMVFRNGTLYATGGDSEALPGLVSLLTPQGWENILDAASHSFGAIDVRSSTPEQWAIGAKDQGLRIYQNQQLTTQFTPANSPIESNSGQISLSGLRYDTQGVLWMVQQNASHPVKARAPDGSWKSFAWPVADQSGILHFDTYGQGWIASKNEGLFVFRTGGTLTDETDDKSIKFYPHTVFGQTIRTIYCLSNDLNGRVWIGTESGPVIFPDPANITQGVGTGGTHILVPGEDEPDMAFPLLGSEPVLSIAVNGANQKWLGTATGGAFLLSEDGQKELLHFTTSNSALPSNMITGIAINDLTGEVFFQTEYGIVGYRGTAVAASEDFSHMYAYPNPVRESFQGNITFTGLVQSTHLKVTDISGNMIFETISQGGQAFWDGRNARGNRVSTGVYLILCTNEDGSKTHIEKLLFIH